jgi:hypothetical protein
MAVDLTPTIAALLLECLCEAVNANANPPAHCCYRLPGEVAMDADMYTNLCCQGLAYVSVSDFWVSSNSFPEQDIIRQAQARCAPPSWGVELKMGIIRCAPVGTDTTMPTCADFLVAHTQSLVDAQSLRQAACCFRNNFPNLDPQLDGMSVVISRQTANTPQGGCFERSMQISAQFPTACDGC